MSKDKPKLKYKRITLRIEEEAYHTLRIQLMIRKQTVSYWMRNKIHEFITRKKGGEHNDR